MAMRATAINTRSEQRTDIEHLPQLFTRLGDDVTQFFDTKISLLRVEVKEDVTAFLKAGIGIAAAVMVALLGFALISFAAAYGIATLLANNGFSQTGASGVGFVIVGLVYLVLGMIFGVVMKNRLSRQSLVPNRSVAEIRKDKEWLKNEL